MKNDFEQRRANRIENAKKRALKNEAEADGLYNRAKQLGDVIPFGQPILVGHHSEKRDRAYRNKIHNTMDKSFEKSEKAAYYAEKAETIENNTSIFSDDPHALQKLEVKLTTLKELQDFMKAANKFVKKNDKVGFLKIKHATEAIWTEIILPDYANRVGFPSYRLTNNNANIKRIEQRIKSLQKQESVPFIDKVINEVRVFENREANRVQLFFNGKPAPEIIKKLKSHGFRWCRTEVAWQRHISPNAIYWAALIAQEVQP